MGSERQCGLSSLVPMSCRGRAEAFARRLHTRLRRLGAESPPEGDSNLQTKTETETEAEAEVDSPHSPQSPIELPPTLLSETSPASNSDSDATYYDIDADSDSPKLLSHFKLQRIQQSDSQGVKVSPEAVDQIHSPIQTQPLAREVGNFPDYGSIPRKEAPNALYSPIKFDDCPERQTEETDVGVEECAPRTAVSESPDDEAKRDETESNVSNEADDNDNDNDNDNDDRPQRVRRCSSLRSGKTPPGTPGRKKIVRFADVLGLDLADVKTFMDDIPNIPKSAFEDLHNAENISTSTECFVLNEVPKTLEKRLVAVFQQPGDQPNFLDILNSKNVCLENALVQEGATIAISGTVRVRNLDFHKSVQIRYTLDSWKSFSDLQASYVPNSCDGFADRFQFLLYAHTVRVGQTLEFAVRFMCKGCQFWDNNSGANYCFQCLSSSTDNLTASLYLPPNINPIDNWHASFF